MEKIKIPDIKALLEEEETKEKRFQIEDLLKMPEYQTNKMNEQLQREDFDFRKKQLESVGKNPFANDDSSPNMSPLSAINKSVDTSSFIRSELHNDLKKRREQERERIKYEAERRRIEVMKNLNLKEKQMEPLISPQVEIPFSQVAMEALDPRGKNRDAERIEQQINEKMKQSELKLKSLRESNNLLALSHITDLKKDKAILNISNGDLDFLKVDKQKLRGLDKIKETLELQKRLLEHKEAHI